MEVDNAGSGGEHLIRIMTTCVYDRTGERRGVDHVWLPVACLDIDK
jgi:hypothetical protein